MNHQLTSVFVAALLASACNKATEESAPDPTGTNTPSPTDTEAPEDTDQDGFSVADGDCNDLNNVAYPGARERSYDGLDANCDGADNPTLGEDRYDQALAELDDDGDGEISLDEFTAACAESAHVFGDAQPGVVTTHATCGGTNLCRGFILHPWQQFFEHDCRGLNDCAGWSCVETAPSQGRDGATIFEEAACSWCHSGDEGAFYVQVPPTEDVEAWLAGFPSHTDERFLAMIAFGSRGISPGDVAGSNMPAYYERLSREEMLTVISYVRTLNVEGSHFAWGDEGAEH
jgi:mono/diheme cytochrome c family protein